MMNKMSWNIFRIISIFWTVHSLSIHFTWILGSNTVSRVGYFKIVHWVDKRPVLMTSLLAGLALLLMLLYDSEVLKKKHLWAFNSINIIVIVTMSS